MDKENPYPFFRFGLIVTGHTEERHLPKLFRSLTEDRDVFFEVICRVGQRTPLTSPRKKKKISMVGTEKKIRDKDT